MKCSNCGAEVPDTDKFCVHCGNDLEKQRTEQSAAVGYCSKCGAPLQKGFKFCVACGAPVPDFTSEPTEPPAESGEVPPDGMTFQPNAEDTSEINLPAQNLTATGPIPYDASAENNNENATFSADEGAVPPEKEEKSKKTNRILTIVIIVLLVLAIAAVAVFLVLHFQGNSNNAQNRSVTTVSESEPDQQDTMTQSPPTQRVRAATQDYVVEPGDRLIDIGYDLIEETQRSWGHPQLWGGVASTGEYRQSGNDIVYLYEVSMDYSSYSDDPNLDIKHDSYYTYVRFNNVYDKNGEIHYSSYKKPKGEITNMAIASDGSHYVAGYPTDTAAFRAAGV